MLQNICDILQSKPLSSNVINAHVEILQKMKKKASTRKVIFFDSNIWLFVRKVEENRDPHKLEGAYHVDSVISENVTSRWDLMVFPINTNGWKGLTRAPNWPLLVYNPSIPKWTLHNSMRSRNKQHDGFLADATYVKNYVEKKIAEVYKKMAEKGIQPETPLEKNIPIESCETFPQHISNSNDCGYFACMGLEVIADGEEMPPLKLMEEDMADPRLLVYKVVLISRLILDYSFSKK